MTRDSSPHDFGIIGGLQKESLNLSELSCRLTSTATFRRAFRCVEPRQAKITAVEKSRPVCKRYGLRIWACWVIHVIFEHVIQGPFCKIQASKEIQLYHFYPFFDFHVQFKADTVSQICIEKRMENTFHQNLELGLGSFVCSFKGFSRKAVVDLVRRSVTRQRTKETSFAHS